MADGLLTQPLRDFGRGYNREAVAGLLGAPVDMTTQLINLLIAGGGYAAHKAGLVNQPPDLIDPARAVGSSDWIYQRLPAQPAMTGSRSEQAGRLAGALLSPPAVMQAAPKVTRTLAQALREKLPIVAENYMARSGMAPNIVVYHGSPHRFDQFDSSKIGTGEGAQVYGHGLYFAEDPGVAAVYRDMPHPALGADPRDSVTALRQNWQTNVKPRFLKDEEVAYLMRDFPDLAPFTSNPDIVKNVARVVNGQEPGGTVSSEAIYAMRALDKMLPPAPKGNLYKVDLPDPVVERMLDWNKPLSQQASGVQPVLRDMFDRTRKSFSALDPKGDPIFGQLHHLYGQHRGGNSSSAVKIAEELRQAGIPGIRYLDGGSRDAGFGTSNFVVFPGEEKALTILERNDQPLQIRKGSR